MSKLAQAGDSRTASSSLARSCRDRHRLLERVRVQQLDAAHPRFERLTNRGGVAADHDRSTRDARNRRSQRREVLALAVASENHEQLLALGRQPFERGDGGADIGALAVVVILDAVDRRDQLQPMRLAGVASQCMHHRRQRTVDRARQAQSPPAHSSRCAVPRIASASTGIKSMHQQLRDSAPAALISCSSYARADARSPRPTPARRRRGRPRSRTRRRQVGASAPKVIRCRVFFAIAATDRRVQNLAILEAWAFDGLCLREDARLGSGVSLHRVVPVEMIIGDVQHGGGVATKRARRRQLESSRARAPRPRANRLSDEPRAQRVERSRTRCCRRPAPACPRLQSSTQRAGWSSSCRWCR